MGDHQLSRSDYLHLLLQTGRWSVVLSLRAWLLSLNWVWTQALPWVGWMTLGKYFPLCHRFLLSKIRDNYRVYLIEFVFFFFLNYFIYLFLTALGLCCCTRAASGGYSCCGARASHCGGFSCCGARALGTQASVVVAHGLSSCGLQALERRLSSCGRRA